MDIRKFEEEIHKDLHQYLVSQKVMDEKMPECPDLEDWWPKVEEAYLPDGVKEFKDYPLVSLGWIMFVGMAFAKFWDSDDWIKYSEEGPDKLYHRLVEAKGFDNLDDHILEDVLGLPKDEAEKESETVGECAARVLSALHRTAIEPGTKDAVLAYEAVLHQLYLMGIAMELNSLGYHMTPYNPASMN